MANGICDICKSRPASFRAQVSANGERKVMELCDEDYRRIARRQGRSGPRLRARRQARSAATAATTRRMAIATTAVPDFDRT